MAKLCSGLVAAMILQPEMVLPEMVEAAIEAEGVQPHGKHHEIYLKDPNRTAPEKLRTILRQPVR